MKKVIFIAGTSYSGSSMLDMMLGSSDSSFSAGEVRALFHPSKKHQILPPCGCGDIQCDIWKKIKKDGADRLYAKIFDMFENVDTIIDSSKNYFWIAKQRKMLKDQKIMSAILLIWKYPEEFALSRLKRRQFENWEKAWLEYHKMFFSIYKNSNIRAICYRDLVKEPGFKLEQICKNYGIGFSPKMTFFWEKKHHMLFGNTLAKYHMYEKENERFTQSVNNLKMNEIHFENDKRRLDTRHRSIYYQDEFKSVLPQKVFSEIADNRNFEETVRILQSIDVKFQNTQNLKIKIPNKLKYSRLFLLLKNIKYCTKNLGYNQLA